jgi:hypothetical protein
LPHWQWSQPERYCGSAGSRDDFGGGSSTSKGRCDLANISASLPNAGWLTVHARRHQREVCPVARGGDVPTPIRPITGRPSLAPSSCTRCPVRSSYDSPCCPRTAGQQAYHVPQAEQLGWCRPRLCPGGASSAPEKFGASGPDQAPFGPSLAASLACPM